MPCLIFRATNERSCSLPQTSSQAAIIPSKRKCAWKAEGREHYLTRSANSVYVWRRCVCVCVYLSVCESVRLYLSTLLVCVCQPAPSYPSVSSCVCVCVLYRSRHHPGAVCFINHRKDLNNSLRFFYFFPPESPASFNYEPILVLGAHVSMRIYPNKCFWEVCSNSSAGSE